MQWQLESDDGNWQLESDDGKTMQRQLDINIGMHLQNNDLCFEFIQAR